jgi:hypothetical protein
MRALDDLLMSALNRTISLKEVDRVAVLVAEDLYFDMPRDGDVLLDEDDGIAERLERLALCRVEGVAKVGGRLGDLHPFAAAALPNTTAGASAGPASAP